MYFLELVNFHESPSESVSTLRAQLTSHAQKIVRWVEWNYQLNSLVPNPDVCLIFAANENWLSIKKMVDNTTANSIVLYGCDRPLLALPVLSNIQDIDELLHFVNIKPNNSTFVTTEPKPSLTEPNRTWKKTIPMQLTR